jgi:Holliday junction resolvasome RuvABC endonuclease subunit
MNKGARRRMVHLTPTESVLLTLSMPTADKLFPGHLSEIMSGIRAKALALGIPVRQNLRWPTGEGAGIVEANRSTPSIEPGGTPRDFYCTLPLNTPDHLKKWVENWANSFSTTITLDIATATGWALLTRGQIHQTGTLVLATKEELAEQQKSGKNRTGDVRFAHLLAFLENQIKTGVERIVFEDVLFAKSPDQAQLWASLRAAIWAACRGTAVHVCCVSATTLKMFATANGAARKHQMAEALAKADPSYVVYDAESGSMLHDAKLIDNNQVDAIWLARYTVAVDAGEVRFQSVAESKAAAREAKRAERAALVAAAKATGRCCGLLRRPAPFGRAKCRKCGRVVTLGIHKPA